MLSLGYYVETEEDQTYTAGLHHLLVDLASVGVTTFASAGNDSTSRKSYPAAFATQGPFGSKGLCALVSVAALNPDGTVALFSNDGDWVTAEARRCQRGVDGAASPSRAGCRPRPLCRSIGRDRSSIDPDGFSGGFATWSGTSFAAPVLAGRFLAAAGDRERAGRRGDPAGDRQEAAALIAERDADDQDDRSGL